MAARSVARPTGWQAVTSTGKRRGDACSSPRLRGRVAPAAALCRTHTQHLCTSTVKPRTGDVVGHVGVPIRGGVDGREKLEHLRRVRRMFTRAGDDDALRLVRALEERVMEELAAERRDIADSEDAPTAHS